jgi:hypothetical protein
MNYAPIGPWHIVVRMAEELLENDMITIFQLFRCQHCGSIQKNDEPDTFHEVGVCECGFKNDLIKEGCGFFGIIGDKKEVIEEAFNQACGGKPQGLPS